MELHGSQLGSLGFSRTNIYESVLMCFKDAICLRKILLKMALDTVYMIVSLEMPMICMYLPITSQLYHHERIFFEF
jgi:hypothetical protein